MFAANPGPWTGHDYDALAAEVTALVADSGPPDPLPGATDLIAAAHRLGVPVAVVTSAGPAWTTRAIEGPLGADRTGSTWSSPPPTWSTASPTRPATGWPANASASTPRPRSPSRTPRPAYAPPSPPVSARSSASPPPTTEAELSDAGAARVLPDLTDLAIAAGGAR